MTLILREHLRNPTGLVINTTQTCERLSEREYSFPGASAALCLALCNTGLKLPNTMGESRVQPPDGHASGSST